MSLDHRQRFQTDSADCKSVRRSSTYHSPLPGNAPSRGTTGRNRGCNGRQRDVSTNPSQSAVARVHTVMTHSSLLCHGFGFDLWVHWARVVTHLHFVRVELDAAVLVELKRLEIRAVCTICLRAHRRSRQDKRNVQICTLVHARQHDRETVSSQIRRGGLDAWRRGLIGCVAARSDWMRGGEV